MYHIPFDYDSFYKKFIIITGVGRSGTTILGKLIGSMQPSYYLFEPTILRFFLPQIPLSGFSNFEKQALKAVLFEDYFLPLVQGRDININCNDDSWVLNYRDVLDVWPDLSRRKDAIEYLRQIDPYFIIKIPEFQPLYEAAKIIFPNVKFINIIRNGNDVISSALNRDWYSDDFDLLEICDSNNAPWYIDSSKYWGEWHAVTRAACIWRCCICERDNIRLEYDDLLNYPEKHVEFFESWFDLKRTNITNRHIDAIKVHKKTKHKSILHLIQQPEKEKYINLMQQLGYEI